MKLRLTFPGRFAVGPFDAQWGGLWHRVGCVRVPDGLHLWWGDRYVHLFWKRGGTGRVLFGRAPTTAVAGCPPTQTQSPDSEGGA